MIPYKTIRTFIAVLVLFAFPGILISQAVITSSSGAVTWMWGYFTVRYEEGTQDTGIVIVNLYFPYEDYSKHGVITITKKEEADEFVEDLQYMIDHWNEDSLTKDIRIDREKYRMAFFPAEEQDMMGGDVYRSGNWSTFEWRPVFELLDLMIGDAKRSDCWSKLERLPAINLLDFIRTQSKKLP